MDQFMAVDDNSSMTNRPSDGRSKAAIGERLRLTRQALGMAQGDFASRAGIAANTYNQYEGGVNKPDLDKANAICDAYQVTLGSVSV